MLAKVLPFTRPVTPPRPNTPPPPPVNAAALRMAA